MTDTVIRVENLSKRYRIGVREKQSESLREAVGSLLTSPFRYLQQMSRPPSDEETLWALKEVSFEVKQGDVLGIIGRNGAGKSTLLKILSRITEPTEGRAVIDGRVGSLLEVGTGFHPELTGRENIYLNGAILGMKRREIESKFDEIVDFSAIERFIDTPVKRYSSGMFVRLAFAVAAHLEPEILIVDEVLAVGDVAFQQKCLGKIGDVARQGRTVLFVSHNMGLVARLSRQGILLEKGQIVDMGDISSVVSQYINSVMSSDAELVFQLDPKKNIQMRSARLLNHLGQPSTEIDRTQICQVEVEFEVRQPASQVRCTFMLDKTDGTLVCHSADTDQDPSLTIDRAPGIYRSRVTFPGNLLNAGAYLIRLGINSNGEVSDYQDAFTFNLIDSGTFAAHGVAGQQRRGLLAIPLDWQVEQLTELSYVRPHSVMPDAYRL